MDTAAQLRARYLHVKNHHTKLFTKLAGESFEQELHRLMLRYKPGNTIEGTKLTTRAQQALPTPLHNVLHNLIGSTTERLASPLNVAMPTSAYWSLHERDRLFGANWNAYSVQWTGPSIAVPDQTDTAAAVQAIKWAQQSAQQAHTPTLTLLVLPAYGIGGTAGGYMRWVQQHPYHCKHLLCLPKSSVKWQLPANALHETASFGKFNVNVIAVGNEEGFSTHLPYWTAGWRDELQHRVREALQQCSPEKPLPQCNYIANADDTWWNLPPCRQQRAEVARFNRKFRTLPKDFSVRKKTASITTLMNVSDTAQAVHRARSALRDVLGSPPLRHNWQNFAYTDGSVLTGQGNGKRKSGPGIGAAVHVPADDGRGRDAVTVAIDCKYLETDDDTPAVNTINRAELVAISTALEATSENLLLHNPSLQVPSRRSGDGVHSDSETATPIQYINIATDSLASICQIWKWLTRPQDMQEHRHKSILQDIGNKIENSPQTIHIWKVKSHIGIVGNEKADETAVAVANGTLHDADELHSDVDTTITDQTDSTSSKPPTNSVSQNSGAALTTTGSQQMGTDKNDKYTWRHYTNPSNDRRDMYWPHYKHTKARPEQQMNDTDQTHQPQQRHPCNKQVHAKVYTPLPNMAESLKLAMHSSRKLGLSNKSTTYYNRWKPQLHDIDDTHSHLFMTSGTVTPRQRKRMLQYRYGLLPTHKLLYRYKKVNSTACPLCGGEDGGHHAISACPALSNAVTLRHNEAGTAILKAIHQGCKGRMLLTSDVGWRKRHNQETDPPLPRAATTKMLSYSDLPGSIPTDLQDQLIMCSVPDALLYDYNQTQDTHHYTIVEVKYCRDTDPTQQQARASQQHQKLRDTIARYAPDATIDQVTLMLGVSGVIYKSFNKALEDKLGVIQPRLNTLLIQLHYIAVNHLNRIWDQRWAMIINKPTARAKPGKVANGRLDGPISKKTGKQPRTSTARQQPPKQGQG